MQLKDDLLLLNGRFLSILIHNNNSAPIEILAPFFFIPHWILQKLMNKSVKGRSLYYN